MHFPGVALITGAGSEIGRSAAKLFERYGCSRIVLCDVSSSKLNETKDLAQQGAHNADIGVMQCDVASESAVKDMISNAVKMYGRIDYACNAAGILLAGPSPEFPVSKFDQIVDVNLREPLKSNDSPIPVRGAIVNVASMAGLRAYEDLPAYTPTKHGVIGFSKADGLRYGRDHIRVNAVCPGIIARPMLTEVPKGQSVNLATLTKDVAMNRAGTPDEVAEALVWIVSGRASHVTATTLAVNAGMIGA